MSRVVYVESKVPLSIQLRHNVVSPLARDLILKTFGPRTKCDYTRECGSFLEFYHEDTCVGVCGFYLQSNGRYLLHTDCVRESYRGAGIGRCMHVARLEHMRWTAGIDRPFDIHVESNGDGHYLLRSIMKRGIYDFQRVDVGGRYLVYTWTRESRPIIRVLRNVRASSDLRWDAFYRSDVE